jgi:hypothetical protein
MNRSLALFVCLFALLWSASCQSGSAQPPSGGTSGQGVVVNVTGSFQSISSGAAPVTLTAAVIGAPQGDGVVWSLSIANTSCSPDCGTLKYTSGGVSSLSAIYTPPATAPTNNSATITVTSTANPSNRFVFNFQIFPPVSLSIGPKFSTQTATGPSVNLSATISNDFLNAGVNWTLTAGGSACSPSCGTITPGPAPVLTATYTPPAVPPSGASANPTIAAASVTNPGVTDSFSFNILAPPITVAIVSKFSTQSVGSPAVTVNGSITNDFTNAGLTWTLTAGGAACSPACGTLTPASAPALSAVYLPPTTLPTGAAASPTISATSVADPTKSDSFTFNIVQASSIFNGSYALLLRGFTAAGNPVVIAGSITSNGIGNITGGELDINDNGTLFAVPSPLTGSYTLDTTFNGIPRVQITLNLPSTILPPFTSLGFDCTLSSDGTRGKIIELDGTSSLVAGTILQQDPGALAAANPAGTYAFGVDSDTGNNAGLSGRIVEAGQIVIGVGGTSVTGGVADASQVQSANPVFGGALNPPATLDAASTATAPDVNGRGTITLSFAGDVAEYAYYIVSAQQLNLIQIDTGGTLQTVFSGTAHVQNALTASSMNATSVIALTGINGAKTAPIVVAGVVSISGTTGNATYDTNNGNSALHDQTTGIGFVTAGLDVTTGRAVIRTPSIATTFVGAAAVYLYDTGQGYVIDVTPNNGVGANHALSGPLLLQTAPAGGQFAISTSLTGNVIGLGGGSSSPAAPNVDFAMNLAGGSGGSAGYSALVDLTTTNTALGNNGQVQAYSFTGDYSIIPADASIGHGAFQIVGGAVGDPTTSDTDVVSFYIIGLNQFVAINLGPNAAGNGVPSSVMFFDPE